MRVHAVVVAASI